MPINQRFLSVREPIRQAAEITMATTAGLMPNKIPATTGKSPNATYSHESPINISKDGSTNNAPAMMPPTVRCISHPI